MTRVFVCNIDYQELDLGRFKEKISPYRYQKAMKITHKEARVESIYASLLLDFALSEFSLRERDMRYYENEFGKPFFKNCELFFSVSHTNSAVAVALSSRPIGVDIERDDREISDKLIRRYFSCEEIDWACKENSEKVKLWAAKESQVKYTGRGFSIGSRDESIPFFDETLIFNGKKIAVFRLLDGMILGVTADKDEAILPKKIILKGYDLL